MNQIRTPIDVLRDTTTLRTTTAKIATAALKEHTEGWTGGQSPTAQAAAAYYAAGLYANSPHASDRLREKYERTAPTQREVADLFDVTPIPIRASYKDYLNALLGETHSTDE